MNTNEMGLKQEILAKEGIVFSTGSHNLTDLLSKAYDLLDGYELNEPLRQEIATALGFDRNGSASRADYYNELEPTISDMELSELLNEDVFNYFETLAPCGYYFGTAEGDGACFGFFQEDWVFQLNEFLNCTYDSQESLQDSISEVLDSVMLRHSFSDLEMAGDDFDLRVFIEGADTHIAITGEVQGSYVIQGVFVILNS